MTKPTLVWREGRSTPIVQVNGKDTSKGTGGKVVARRKATDEEEKKLKKGQWIRSRPPGQPNKKSSVRPQLAAKQKKKNDGKR